MMARTASLIFFLLLTVGNVALASAATPEPEPVPPLTQRRLEPADYAELARQWKSYIAEGGETARALVNLGMAYDYGGEERAALSAARRAVELEPDDPPALAFLGKMLIVLEEDEDAALAHLQRCRELAPGYVRCLYPLASTYLRRGETHQAREVCTALFTQNAIARPLQDFAYNLLVGLPQGAVLVTSGDNDTFAALALQGGMGFRRDVLVVNRSLLNLPRYAKAAFAERPDIRPDVDLEHHETTRIEARATTLSSVLIESLIDEAKAPVYIAPTAAFERNGYEPTGEVEGMNLRATGAGLSPDESARLFLDTYRLDSATDWNFAWTLHSGLAILVRNYVSAMVRNAQQEGLSPQLRQRLLEQAESIGDFHQMEGLVVYIRKLQAS